MQVGLLRVVRLSDYASVPEIGKDLKRIDRDLTRSNLTSGSRVRAQTALTRCADYHLWTVVATEFILNDVIHSSYCSYLAQVVMELKMGRFSQDNLRFKHCGDPAGDLFFVSTLTAGVEVAWTIQVYDGSHRICILSLVKRTALAQVFALFSAAYQRLDPDYISACKKGIVSRNGIVYLPKSQTIVTETANCIATNMADCASAKLFRISNQSLLDALTRPGEHRYALPYILDRDQSKAVKLRGSLVIIGRGGTGKTTVLARRMFDTYCLALREDKQPPDQLFLSQSLGLVHAIQTEFCALVETLHDTEPDLLRPAIPIGGGILLPSHRVCFCSMYELIRMLDSLLDPEERLFEDSDMIVRSTLTRWQTSWYTLDSIVDFDGFTRIYYSSALDSVRKMFAPEFVFAEIMSFIKQGISSKGVSRDEYLNMNQRGTLTQTQRNAVYDFFEKYEHEKGSRHHIDYPQLVAELTCRLPRCILPFSTIYIDEVQDLMQSQWRLLDLLKGPSTDIVCSGDQAQTITRGTVFRFASLKAFLYHEAGNEAPRQVQLRINYRTTLPVLRLANRLLNILRHFFPDDIDALVVEESAHPESTATLGPRMFQEMFTTALPFLFEGGSDDPSAVVNIVSSPTTAGITQSSWKELSAEQVILVRDAASKDAVERELANRSLGCNVLTILEAKGLEFDDVVLVNVFSSISLGQRLRVLYNAIPAELREGLAVGRLPVFDTRKHFELCQCLKELYVAVTRAKNRLLIIDDDLDARQVCLPFKHRLT